MGFFYTLDAETGVEIHIGNLDNWQKDFPLKIVHRTLSSVPFFLLIEHGDPNIIDHVDDICGKDQKKVYIEIIAKDMGSTPNSKSMVMKLVNDIKGKVILRMSREQLLRSTIITTVFFHNFMVKLLLDFYFNFTFHFNQA